MYNILLVDDDQDNLETTKDLLEIYPEFKVDLANSGFEAIQKVKHNEYALIVMDYHMPELSGAEATKQIKHKNPRQQIIMYSADNSKEALLDFISVKPEEYIDKDVEPEIFVDKIRKYCKNYDYKIRKIHSEKTPTEIEKYLLEAEIVGRSEVMYNIVKQARKIAKSKQSILIMGESGTGKELVAKAIHDFSSRKDNNFIAINGAAISKHLAESELFGHVKGAFTGAHKKKIGYFQQAHQGTIFIDEVAELDPEIQAKLLRVIQEGTFYSVGSEREEKTDVRIVAATKENLKEKVDNGEFREDLFYRLGTMHLSLPPLRERKEDIEPLIAYFTEAYNKENNANKAFSMDTLDTFKHCMWIGNIRELAAAITNHLVLSEKDLITPDQLISNVIEPNRKEAISLEKLESELNHKKWDYITTLARTCKNKAELSRKLDIKPNRLHYTIEALRKSLNLNDELIFS